MKNYNEVISALREVARDFLRLRRINGIRTDVLQANNEIKSIEDAILAEKKQVARAEFRLTSLNENDPDLEDKTKDYNDNKEYALKSIERYEKEKANVTHTVADLNAKLADISSGKHKVDMEELEGVTHDLLETFIKDHALGVATELTEVPAPEVAK
jgi:chromosome segregation ATPase